MTAGLAAAGGSAVGEIPQPTTALEIDDDAHTTTEVSIDSFDGTTIAGTLYEPTAEGPHPAILLTHGWGGDRSDLTELAATYAAEESETESSDDDGIGFGTPAAIAGVEGLGYLLFKRRNEEE